MRSMLERLETYLDRKSLEFNTEKTKIVRFQKGGRRRKKVDWLWKRKSIEEVRKYKYLGYVIQRNGKQKAQIRDKVEKATAVMRNREEEVWEGLSEDC